MTMGVSSLGTASALNAILQNNQTQMNNLSEQLASGEVSQTLAGYGAQGEQVLDLDSSIAAANAYVGTTTNVTNVLNGYNDGLNELVDDANQLSQGLDNLSNSGSGVDSASFQALVSGLELDTSTTLNTQVGTRFIFSGTRYNTAPVQSIASLPGPAAPTAFTAVASPTLPAYDSQAPGSDAAAWASPTATISPGETLSYGITSNDPSIQQLVYALQNAAAATTATPANQPQYISLAQNALQQALSGLQTLQAQNGANINQVQTAQTAQQQSVTTLTNVLDGIQNVNTTQVSEQITSLQTQMEASYKVTSSLLNLSLVNYLNTAAVT
jgi:flagellar hook-associated protein 3 FlgL